MCVCSNKAPLHSELSCLGTGLNELILQFPTKQRNHLLQLVAALNTILPTHSYRPNLKSYPLKILSFVCAITNNSYNGSLTLVYA